MLKQKIILKKTIFLAVANVINNCQRYDFNDEEPICNNREMSGEWNYSLAPII
jgi:hypothetical protein